MEMEMQNVP